MSNGSMKNFRLGRIFFALLFFAIINSWIFYFHPLSKSPVAGREWGEAYNAVKFAEKDLKENENLPYVLLAGSSLMVAPVVQAECEFLKVPIQRFRHRRSKFCEELLKQKSQITPPNLTSPLVYNLAIGGATPSDMFLVTRNFLENHRKPAVIIYGIAPRDFQDNLIAGAQTTETFENLGTIFDLMELRRHNWLTKSAFNEAIIEKLSPFWKDRQDIRNTIMFYLRRVLEKATEIAGQVTHQTLVLGPDIIRQFPEKMAPTPVATPGQSIETYPAKETLARYKLSYQPLNRNMLKTQFHYFEHLLKGAQEKKTSVIIVNMPISTENKKLLPLGFYDNYLAAVSGISSESGAHFIDFNVPPWDKNTNFTDTVHLTPSASAEFLTALFSSSSNSSRSASTTHQISEISSPQSDLKSHQEREQHLSDHL